MRATSVVAATYAESARRRDRARLASSRDLTRSSKRSVTSVRPLPQAALLESKVSDLGPHSRQRLGNLVLSILAAIEEHEATSPRARDLAPESPVLQSLFVCLINEVGRDVGRHLALVAPGNAQELTKVIQPSPQYRILHLDR